MLRFFGIRTDKQIDEFITTMRSPYARKAFLTVPLNLIPLKILKKRFLKSAHSDIQLDAFKYAFESGYIKTHETVHYLNKKNIAVDVIEYVLNNDYVPSHSLTLYFQHGRQHIRDAAKESYLRQKKERDETEQRCVSGGSSAEMLS